MDVSLSEHWELVMDREAWRPTIHGAANSWTTELKPPYGPAISLIGIYSEGTKMEKDTCNPVFIAALFTIVKTLKQPRRSSTDEWIKQL